MVMGPGWWQGTLDAFGVGFTVGGVVDVVAISGLNQVVAERQRVEEAERARELMRQKVNERAVSLLRGRADPFEEAEEAITLLRQHGDDIDPSLVAGLRDLIWHVNPRGRGFWSRGLDGGAPLAQDGQGQG
jgi:hypothetical protein